MDIRVEPGRYVVGVSGGVDSMVLLDMLAKIEGVDLIVAYYDHGIRTDSDQDRVLVEQTAQQLGVIFVTEQGRLGAAASEAIARDKRYEFLRRTQTQYNAKAIVTAHHQDDVLETAIINLIRGTGRKGLTALANSSQLQRPLLEITKQDIVVYAKSHGIVWREDSTNSDTKYLRNHIRHNIMPKFGHHSRSKMLSLIKKARLQNKELDDLIIDMVDPSASEIPRRLIAWSSFAVSCEILASWLRTRSIEFDRKSIERLAIAVKTMPPGKHVDISGRQLLRISKEFLSIEDRVTTRQRRYNSV